MSVGDLFFVRVQVVVVVRSGEERAVLVVAFVKRERGVARKVVAALVAPVVVQRMVLHLRLLLLLLMVVVETTRPELAVVLSYAREVHAAEVDEREVGKATRLDRQRVTDDGVGGRIGRRRRLIRMNDGRGRGCCEMLVGGESGHERRAVARRLSVSSSSSDS